MAFRYIGTSTTTITNEGTENPTINGIVVTTKAEGDIVFYQSGRYVWLDDMWNYQGDLHTHADVQSALNEIAEAYKGEEVRGSIYDAIALIDTRSAAMEDTIGANINSMVEPIVDRKISTFILDYETSDGNVAQCNLTYEQLRTKLTSNLKAIVHVDGYECDCYIDVHSDYIDVYATSDPMKNNSDTRGTIYYKFNHDNESVTVIYEQSTKKYQEKLTAGPNIIINDNEISAVGGVNTIGIEFYIDTNSTYSRDEITINKTWSEVELYMDAVYDGDWDYYDLWREIQKDCVLKDLRDYPDYSIYPLIGVKYCEYSQGDPVLIFSSRTISNGIPQNNIHYISFIWPHYSWTDQQVETNSIDEFDDNGDNQPLYIKNGSTNSCTMSYSEVMSIINNSRKIFRPQLKVSGITGSSSYNGTYEFIEYVIPSANYVWLWFKSTIMEQTQEDAPLYYKPSFILIEHKSDGEVRFRMQTFAEYQAKLSPGDGISMSYNNISAKLKNNGGVLADSDGLYVDTSKIQPKLTAGSNITIDNTDPANPVISSTGGGGGNTDVKRCAITLSGSTATSSLSGIELYNLISASATNTIVVDITLTTSDKTTYHKSCVASLKLRPGNVDVEIEAAAIVYNQNGTDYVYWLKYFSIVIGAVTGNYTGSYTVTDYGIQNKFSLGNGVQWSSGNLTTKQKNNGGVLVDSNGLYVDTSRIQTKLTAGTGIDITNGVISLDLPQAEGGGF